MHSANEIISIIKGVRLSLTGGADLSKYNFKTKVNEKFGYYFLDKICKTEHDARLLGAGLFWEKIYHTDITPETCSRILEEWKWRYEKPSSVLSDISIESIEDLKTLLKETVAGPALLNYVNQKRIHPITFCYIDKLTKCSLKWSSLNWKLSKQKFEMLEKVVDIRDYSVVQLSKYLIKTFKEHKDE